MNKISKFLKEFSNYSDFQNIQMKAEAYKKNLFVEFSLKFCSDLIKELKILSKDFHIRKLIKNQKNAIICLLNDKHNSIEITFYESDDLEIYTVVNGSELNDNKPRNSKDLAEQINQEL